MTVRRLVFGNEAFELRAAVPPFVDDHSVTGNLDSLVSKDDLESPLGCPEGIGIRNAGFNFYIAFRGNPFLFSP